MQSVTNRAPRPRAIGGFTLIELMAVVVVIAILAVIALPAYTEYIRKSRRAEAISLVSQIAQAQERWRANCPSYTANLASAPGAGCTGGLGVSSTSYYTLSVTFPAASSVSYAATASAAGAQSSDAKCTSFTLAASGGNFSYASTGTAASSVCWSRR
jgi:type IV pilus assembly protein PilE